MNKNKEISAYLKPGCHVHLVGIGGVSMRPLGLVLKGMGMTVSGSDMSSSVSTDELIAHGIHVDIGHSAKNIEGADCIIRTAAAHNDNPEIAAARAAGILLMEPGNSYTRKDGSKGVNIHIKRVFDISQTTLTPTKQPAVSQDTRLLLNAMVRYAPCKVDFRDELPDGQSALYSPQEKTVFVRRGQSMEDVFRGVAQELAHAYLDTGNYSRENNIFLAQCVGNILCQRNGIDGKSLAITQLPQKYTEMEPKQLREELKSIRTAANQISADMFRFLDAKSHGSRQRDDAR